MSQNSQNQPPPSRKLSRRQAISLIGIASASLVVEGCGRGNQTITPATGSGNGGGQPPTRKWVSTIADEYGFSAPLVVGEDGVVYAGTFHFGLFALNGETGATKWVNPIRRPSRPAIGAGGTIYLITYFGAIDALNGTTGAEKWSVQISGQTATFPAIGADGTVYVGSSGNSPDRRGLYAFDGATGVIKWRNPLVTSTPVIGPNGTVYVQPRAFDPTTGVVKNDFAPGNLSDFGVPSIGADGTLYLGGTQQVYALDGTTGAIKWQFATPGGDGVLTPLIGRDGTIYLSANELSLYALDGATGAKKWQFTSGGSNGEPALGPDGTVYVGSADGNLYALDGTTGAKKWDYEAGIGERYTPAVAADGTIYITIGKSVVALK